MKTLKSLVKAIMAIALVISVSAATAQSTSDKVSSSHSVKGMLASHNFVFKAQTLFPETGAVQQLTGGNYTLTLTNNSIVVDMPYFVKAAAASIDASQGGLQFKSTNFKYSENKLKRGWAIVLEPMDVGGDNLKMLLTIYNDKVASLVLTSEARQSVVLDGFVEAQQ